MGHRTASVCSRWLFIGKKQKGKKMAVAIRLARHGAKKRPYYHIVVTDSRLARDSGSILETVGKYDPMQPRDSERRVTLNADKIKSWMGKGARPSDRVYRLLANAGLVAARVVPVQTKKNQQSEKTLMKIKDRETKLAKAAEETAKPTEPVVEAPAEAPAEPVAQEASAEPVAETAPEPEAKTEE